MATTHLIDPADIRFSHFRLPHENLSSGGKGCLVHHIPSKNTTMSEIDQPYLLNKKAALMELAKLLGIKGEMDVQKLFHCKECSQEIVPDFPEWKHTQLFVREVPARPYIREGDEFRITVYFQEGDDADDAGWTWAVEPDGDDLGGELYESPAGAVRAADSWLAGFGAAKDDDDADQEGES